MNRAFLGLGSNLGERIFYIDNALRAIKRLKDTSIAKSSSVYETDPWGNENQEKFLNCVIEIETGLNPDQLLNELKAIEKRLGRTGGGKWSEREIDIDILFFEDEIILNEKINIPHGQIEKRRFVLVPMNELAPDFIHPVFKKTMSQLLKETGDNLKVELYQTEKI